ncbi:inositol hexakisphosphate kinase 3, partial [Kappamyces sp. JEL0680]
MRELFFAVAGHKDFIAVLPNCDGRRLKKLVGTIELQFYRHVAPTPLGPFVPRIYWEDSILSKDTLGTSALVMENLLYPWISGDMADGLCVLDLKLGSQLHDHLADEAKIQKMTAKSLHSTSHALGLRICGMRIRGVDTDAERLRNADRTVFMHALASFFSEASLAVRQRIRERLVSIQQA